MEAEIWKDIKNFEGLYQVSNLGRVKSVDRYVKTIHGKYQHWCEKILKPCDNGRGYSSVYLRKDNKKYRFYIHRLVCETFYGDIKGLDVNHKNFKRNSNSLENLEITTREENIHYSRDNGRYKNAFLSRSEKVYNETHKKLLDITKIIKDNGDSSLSVLQLEKKYHFDRRSLKKHGLSIY